MRTPRRDLVCYPMLTKLEPLAMVWGCYMDHTTKRSVEDRIHGWTLKGTLGSRCTIEWDVEGRNVSDVSNYAIVRQAGLITLAAMSMQWKPLQPLLQSVSTDTLSQRQPARVRFRYDTDIADIANFIKLVMKPSE